MRKCTFSASAVLAGHSRGLQVAPGPPDSAGSGNSRKQGIIAGLMPICTHGICGPAICALGVLGYGFFRIRQRTVPTGGKLPRPARFMSSAGTSGAPSLMLPISIPVCPIETNSMSQRMLT